MRDLKTLTNLESLRKNEQSKFIYRIYKEVF